MVMSVNDSLVKKAYTKVNYTPEQIEHLKKCMDPVDGPMYFMKNFMRIQHPVKGSIQFDPYPYQEELIDCYHNNIYAIALLSRQLGKCVTKDTEIETRHGGTYEIISMGDFHDRQQNDVTESFDDDNGKFKERFKVYDTEVFTSTGWETVTYSSKTVEYDVWEIVTDRGRKLSGADNHIIIGDDGSQIFIKDSLDRKIVTENGIETVITVDKKSQKECMYDLSVSSNEHTYYTNGILSHNTTVAAGYLLWFAMFNSDKYVLVAAHKYSGAAEIMDRVRFAYEDLPDFIRAGVRSYNVKSIEFDNGSKIEAETTTKNTGRGKSISLIYLDEFAFVDPPSMAEDLWTSLSPTLSTGGKCLITSTPNGAENTFAKIWFDANNNVDDYGNEKDVGLNGFRPYFATWRAHPDRDEKWADIERGKIGDGKFLQEHECLGAKSLVTLQDENGVIFDITVGELYKKL